MDLEDCLRPARRVSRFLLEERDFYEEYFAPTASGACGKVILRKETNVETTVSRAMRRSIDSLWSSVRWLSSWRLCWRPMFVRLRSVCLPKSPRETAAAAITDRPCNLVNAKAIRG